MDFDRVSMQSGGRLFERPGSDIRLTGYLKKLKTMKKKFFVLRSTSSSGPARLEYYDSEKKFKAGHLPKRSIHLHTCFNINQKSDSRHRNSIALYTKEECFSIICENEKEQENWLSNLLEYQNEYVRDGDLCREHYEHVWQVTLQPKGLGLTMNIRGPYRLCMTQYSIYLVKLNMDKPQYIFQLETVRSLAHNDNLFRLEVGKIAPTGEGELWMQADDALIAQNVHETILNYMKIMDRRVDIHDTRRTDSIIGSAISHQSIFRVRTASESFPQGTRAKMEPRPMSVHTGSVRSTSLHNSSPGTSPHTISFDQPIMGSHRKRSDSSDSKASRSSVSAINDDLPCDMHPRPHIGPTSDIEPLKEESDFDGFPSQDLRSIPSSPGSFHDDFDLQEERYMEMRRTSVTPPASGNSGYMDMAPGTHKDTREGWSDHGSTYMPMNPSRTPTNPIPIHPGHPEPGVGYMDMTSHNPLPPVKESGSSEGYLPMSPSYSASPSGSSSSHLRPDRVACMLSDDGNDFAQPPIRTYSLGSRPVKTGSKYSGYVDMSGRKGVSDNGRSCSAPHLITHHPHHHRNSRNNSNLDSPTPSASPLSMSLRSDDSDSFMELDFYRPRTASDSYSYRPRASSFGVSQSSFPQGHRPRSSSYGQTTKNARQQKMLGGIDPSGRLNHDILHRSQNSSSHGSFDSLRVSSSESLRKLSQEVRTKTSQLNNSDYMDMSFEKRQTPSPQSATASGSRSGQNGYVDMTLGHHRKSSPSRSKLSSRSNSKTSSSEKLQESDYTSMSRSGGGAGVPDTVYMNFEPHEAGGKKDSVSCSSSFENVDTYIMYEPARAPLSGSGKEAVLKGDTTNVVLRSQSGSGGKEHKKHGFFSLHSSKKSESAHQPSAVINFGSTGSSLGHNIRQKSKDAERGFGRKSNSFSRTFGTSATKPGKQAQKTPTPPKQIDGNGEYIEFSPLTVKSDSDSSHSSGSTHVSRSQPDAASFKEGTDYVGFEPGNFLSSPPSTGKQGIISGYVSMRASGGAMGGQSAVFKPVEKSASERSKNKEESSEPVSTESQISSPPQKESLAKPVPVYPSCQLLAPTTFQAVSLLTGLVTGSEGSGTSDKTPTPSTAASSASSSLLPSPDSSIPASPSSSNSSFVMVSRPTPPPQVHESGYMDFDPGNSSVARTSPNSGRNSATGVTDKVPSPSSLAVQGSSATASVCASPSSPSQSSPLKSCLSEKKTASGRNVSADSDVIFSHSPVAPCFRNDKGSEMARTTPARKISVEKVVSGNNGGLRNSPKIAADACSPFSDGPEGSAESRSIKPKEACSPRQPHGLTRPDSTPCMTSMDRPTAVSRGRGRHSSSSSTGGEHSKKGKSSNGNSSHRDSSSCQLDMGMLQINTETDARHSIADLSGYEKMSFPSNALCQQQQPSPTHTYQQQTSQGSGSISGSQGVLNYATLDLGSADSMTDMGESSRSPRNKSRHSSAAEEKCETLSYAKIDFEKSENLRNAVNRDVKRTL